MYSAAIFLPLIASIIAGLFGRFLGDRGAQIVTCGALLISAVLAVPIFYQVAVLGQPRDVEVMTWFTSGAFEVSWALRFDTLSAVMICVVTWVSAAVHVYSIGYMSHDKSIPRFFSYLSLFTFFMLMLVTANNFVQMFFGWEGVGLASYLLIGFWYDKPEANAAAIKAFLVNRVGDFGFALGIMATFFLFNTVAFDQVFAAVPDKAGSTLQFLGFEGSAMTIICILLFIGAMGKSAQIGLHTWLPDAMEGPTPVSALIHAATMVTAGVFMVCRLSPMFEYSETALMVVTIVGATTAIFAASVGMVQNDIKRVIAYSTCSQLGYMFFAAGVSAYPAAMFHLTTHAFFKALLFLGAGSVIHAMSGEQDIRKMGGIYRYIPYTYMLMWVGSLALAGIPFFAGYYSKDIVLEAAYASQTPWGMYAFWLGVLAALLTAFYSWRLLLLTFHGKPRADEKVMHHVHESPNSMLIPMTVPGDRRGVLRLARLRLVRRRAHGTSSGASRSSSWNTITRCTRPTTCRCGSSCHRLPSASSASCWPTGSICSGPAFRARSPIPSAASTCSFTTNGISTSSTTRSSSGRPCASDAGCGKAATAPSSTASARTASPPPRSASRAGRRNCRPATSITMPSPCWSASPAS